jgi:glucokinase
MGSSSIVSSCINLVGNIQATCEEAITPSMSAKEMVLIIEKSIDQTQKRISRAEEKILGIGFSHSAIVNSETGTAFASSKFPNWKNVNIAEHLTERFALPAFAEDSARTKCLAEAQYGSGRGYENFLYINYGEAVGLGVYNEGLLYRGSWGCGCEMGHMIVDRDGPICGCGGKGCLEAIVSTKAITEKAVEAIRNHVQTSMASTLEESEDSERLPNADMIFEAAQEHDRLANSLTESAIQILGVTIGNVCNLFIPSLVILGGDMARFPKVWTRIIPIIRQAAMPFIAKQLEISFAELDVSSGVIGAAELVFERILYPKEEMHV